MVKQARLLLVDQSPATRSLLSNFVRSDPNLSLMGAVPDPYFAVRRMSAEAPDILIVGLNFNNIKTSHFVRQVMSQHPTPILICVSAVNENSPDLIEVMEAGAAAIFVRPPYDASPEIMRSSALEFRRAIASILATPTRRRSTLPIRTPEARFSADVIMGAPSPFNIVKDTEKIVCIGISTGGPESLQIVLEQLPVTAPAIVVVQHMPASFIRAFAQRLDARCAVSVSEARAGDVLQRGTVLIAPGDKHMVIARRSAGYAVDFREGPPVSRHRPSVDVLFRSAARAAGHNAIGIIMTGMGNDGAQGLLEMRGCGSITIAESEKTCIVFGMPKEAIACGAAQIITTREKIAAEIIRLTS